MSIVFQVIDVFYKFNLSMNKGYFKEVDKDDIQKEYFVLKL
jgi:hypothetical protein